MKTLLTIAAVFGLTLGALATGPIQPNGSLSGTITFTNGGPWAYTNNFTTSFTYPPIFSAYLVSANTNALPFTNTVTATNFIVTENSTAAAGTNATIFWTAVPAAYVIQSAATVVNSPLTTNISFPQVYTYIPNVVLTGSTSPSNWVASVTISNFVAVCSQSNTLQWISFGADAGRITSGPNGTDGVVTH